MKLTSPAKINLDLKITGRRDDGYHLLDSTMVFTRWGDAITITPADEFMLSADGPYAHIFTGDLLSTNHGAPNLIVRAVYALIEGTDITPNIHIHITKNIPSGAGLGGGSSNAASVLKALNTYWDLGHNLDKLCQIGLTLGAELPVCIHGTSAKVTGIGDIITPINMPTHNLLITLPNTSLLTKDVFAAYQGETHATNDLTNAAISLCPEIHDIVTTIQSSDGCQNASMSGSGSACFGVFETIEKAETAAKNFKNAIVTMTL